MANITWKNEWNNSAYEKASSQVVAKDKATFDRETEKNNFWNNYNEGNWSDGAAGGVAGGALIGAAFGPVGILIGGILGGIFGGVSSTIRAHIQKKRYEAYLEKTLDAKEDITDSYNNFVDKWNLATQQQLENLNATNKNLQETANITIENRDATLENNANMMYEQGQMYATQLEQMQISNTQNEGKALQNVATSGFRNTGTARNNIQELQRANDRAYNLEKAKVQLSQYQSVAEASNAYKGSTYTAYGYMGNVVENSRLFNQYMQEQELSYEQSKSYYEKENRRYDEDLRDLADASWDTNYAWNAFSSVLDKGLSFLDVSKIASKFV